jgi:hypothetical protein
MQCEFKVEGFRYAGTGERDYGQGIVRVSLAFIQAKHPKALQWPRNQLVRIRHEGSGRRIVCLFRPLISDEPNLLCLEYDDRLKLGIMEKGQFHRLSIKKAGGFRSFGFYWNHPNPLVSFDFRLTVYLTMVSIVLGALLSAISFSK